MVNFAVDNRVQRQGEPLGVDHGQEFEIDVEAAGVEIAAVDFTTIEVWSSRGLVTCYVLFVMELATRRVDFAGVTPSPDHSWMKQIARNLTAAHEGFLLGKRYVLMDRDSKFSAAFRGLLDDAGKRRGLT